MKVIFWACRHGLFIAAIICVLASAITHAADTHFKVGIYHNPPMVFVDEKGIPQGIYVDILNAIAKQESWTLDYVFDQWTELLQKARVGKIDLLTGIAFSPERDTWFDFSQEAIAERWGVVYAPKGVPISAMADLAGKRVALAGQDIHTGFFKQAAEAMGLEFSPVEVEGYEKVFRALQNHKADAGVVSNGYGSSNAQSVKLEATPLVFKPISLVVAFPQGKHGNISHTIDAYLKKWKNEPDSVYKTAHRNWIGDPQGQGKTLALTPEQRAWLVTHPKVRVAFDGYFPPYSYLTDEGHVEGLCVDVLRLLAERLDVRLEIYPNFIWKDLFDAAVRREVDIVATMVQRPEREQWFAFTRPYIYKSLAVMSRDDEATIKQREDIAGKRVALVQGYQYVGKILNDLPSLKPIYVDTMLDGLNAVATGNADAVVTFFGAGSYLKTKYGITNLKFAAVYDRSSSLESIGVRKDWPELVAILDKAISAIEPSTMIALQQKWNADEAIVTSFQQSQIDRHWTAWFVTLAAVSGLALFAFSVVSAWNSSLRRQVNTKTQALEEELTESSRMASALRESEDKFRSFFNSINDAVFVHHLAKKGFARFFEVNDIACERYGYTREEFLKLTAADITKQEDVQDHGRAEFRKKLLKRGSLIFEATHIGKSGKEFPVEISSNIIELNEQKVILAVVRDVTERKLAEEALRSSHERFFTVLDSIDATIYVAGMETYEILFVNKKMIEAFGRDLTGEICWEVFRGESKPCRHCTNDQLIDENGKPTGVCVWQGKNPITEKWYINYDRAIKWTDGRLVKLQIATDITKIKLIEQQLRETQKFEAIGTLAGGIAHDFNNLLMGIQGRISLMAIDIKPAHPHSEHISAIEEYLRSATDLTKQLLGFARGGKFEVKPADINELVLNSSNMFGRTKKEIRIHTKLHNPPPVAAVDRRQIEQVLLNLYVNAWQAMPNGGELYLETKIIILDDAFSKPHQAKPGRYVKVSVTDTGIGMDEFVRQRIFDPFFTTKEKSRGTGLGLASAFGIIKNHDGIITVYSEVDQGTTFNIFLPFSDQEAYTEIPIAGKLIKGSETVLLVDDEEMILEVGKAMLEKLGYRVVIANGGEQAIDTVKNGGDEIDLVILDMIMPGVEGSKAFDLIRQNKPAMPVLLSSGYSLNGQANGIMQRGCNGFIQKPFNISNLSQIVRKILDAAKVSGRD